MTKRFTYHRLVAYAHDGSIHNIIEVPRDTRKGFWSKREAKKYIKSGAGVARVRCEKR